MDFQAERVSELSCGKCGVTIDPSGPKPLSMIDCPKCGKTMRVPAVFGDFLLAEILGTGAAGIVCKGFDQQLHRQVAIKILSKTAADAELVEQCTREARALAALNHRHVVQVHSIGEYRGQPYIVMELLTGGDVQRKMIGRPNDEIEALDIAIATADGLAAAHRAGLVHMDVKPGNILFDDAGTVKLIDFGVAQVASRSTDQVAGTPYYVAPEVIRGHPADHNADIYSLGSTLFHLLTGEPPFVASDAQRLMKKKLARDAPDLLEVRDDLHPRTAEVVAKMLIADPFMRYGDYDELLEDLHDARAQADAPLEDRAISELVSAAASPGPAPARPATRATASAPLVNETQAADTKNPLKLAGIVGAGLLLVAVVIMAFAFGGDEDPPSPEPPPDPVVVDPPPVVTPVLSTSTPVENDADWRRLLRYEATAVSGSTFVPQTDGSLLVDGDVPEADTYTFTATATGPVDAIALELLPDESLPRRGPGRTGNVYLSEITLAVESSDKAGQWEPVKLTSPVAGYSSPNHPIENVIDGDGDSAWSIGPRFGQAHWATFQLAEPIQRKGDVRFRVTMQHHPTYAGFVGRFRVSIKGEAPAVVVKPPDPPKPEPPKPPQPPKPEPPKPEPKPEPATHEHKPTYAQDVDWADEGIWHTLDTIKTTSDGGATIEKQRDGSLLVSGSATRNDIYTVVARTPLSGIHKIRIDALPDASLTDGGPGRGNKGTFAVTWVEVSAGPSEDSVSAVPLKAAVAAGNRAGWTPNNVLAKAGNGWANVTNKPRQSHTLTIATTDPIADTASQYLVIRIHQVNDQALGRFRISATSAAATNAKSPVALHKAQSEVGFVALTPTETTGERAEFAVQDDGSVLVDSKQVRNTFTLTAKTPMTSITAFRLEAMTDPSLPSQGPGLATGGRIAVSEITMKVAPANNPDAPVSVKLGNPKATGGDSTFTIDKAFDDNDRTFWAITKDKGKPQEIIFKPSQPIQYEGGVIVHLTLDQRFSLGRFRLSATSTTDPSALTPRGATDPDKPDAPDDGDAGFKTIYMNIGGPEHKDKDGNVWIATGKYAAKKSPGYVGRVGQIETIPGGDKFPLGTALLNVPEFRADVPNGKYKVSIGLSLVDQRIPLNRRVFTIEVEGKPWREIDIAAVAKPKPRFIPLPPIEVKDGILNVVFKRADGKQSSLSAVIVERVD